MMFGIGIPLTASVPANLPPGGLFDSVERIAEALGDLEDCTPELLDSSLSANASTNEVAIDVTIEAETPGQALDIGIGCIRSAIHTAGDGTPGWEQFFEDALASGRYTSEEVAPV